MYRDTRGQYNPYNVQNGSRSPYGTLRDGYNSYPEEKRASEPHRYGTKPRDVYTAGGRYEEPKYPRFRAVYKYNPQNEDELELAEGDVVMVMEKCDDGWFVGTSERTKDFGTFPGNYVLPL